MRHRLRKRIGDTWVPDKKEPGIPRCARPALKRGLLASLAALAPR